MTETDLNILNTRNWTSVPRDKWNDISTKFTPVRRGRTETMRKIFPDFLFGGTERSWVYLDTETGQKYTVCFQRADGDGVRGVLVKKTRTK